MDIGRITIPSSALSSHRRPDLIIRQRNISEARYLECPPDVVRILDQGLLQHGAQRLADERSGDHAVPVAHEQRNFIGYEWTRSQEQLFEPWAINPGKGVVLPAGKYDFNTHLFLFMTSQSRPFAVMTDFSTGSFFSGTRRKYFGEFTWRKSSHLTAALTLEKNWIRLPEGTSIPASSSDGSTIPLRLSSCWRISFSMIQTE